MVLKPGPQDYQSLSSSRPAPMPSGFSWGQATDSRGSPCAGTSVGRASVCLS